MRTRLPKQAIALIAAVTAAGVAAIAVRLADVTGWTAADLGAALVLATLTAMGERFSLKFRFGDQTKHVTATDTAFAAALLLGVRPSVLILAAVAGVVVTNALRGAAAHKAAFNVGSFALALTAAELVYRAALPAGSALAVAPAMAAFFAVNAGTVVSVIALVEGRTFGSVFRPIARIEYLSATGNCAAGIVGATIWVMPAAAPIAILLIALAVVAANTRSVRAALAS